MIQNSVLRDLNKLGTFVRVAERLSFTRAAADLHTTPSVVSKRVKDLEQLLGFPILNRSTRGVALTRDGQGLYRSCLEMLAKVDHFVGAARDAPEAPIGTLRIHAPSGYARSYLAGRIVDFKDRYPDLKVHISTTDIGEDVVEQNDVIIAATRPADPGLGEVVLHQVSYVVCAAPAYLSRHGAPKTPDDLKRHACLANHYASAKGWRFKLGRKAWFVDPKPVFSSDDDSLLAQWALRGTGIARVPNYEVEAFIKDGGLLPVLSGYQIPSAKMIAYYPRTERMPGKLKMFLDFSR